MYHVASPPGGALFHIDATTLTVQKAALKKHAIFNLDFQNKQNQTNFKNHILLCKYTFKWREQFKGKECERNPVNAFKLKKKMLF